MNRKNANDQLRYAFRTEQIPLLDELAALGLIGYSITTDAYGRSAIMVRRGPEFRYDRSAREVSPKAQSLWVNIRVAIARHAPPGRPDPLLAAAAGGQR